MIDMFGQRILIEFKVDPLLVIQDTQQLESSPMTGPVTYSDVYNLHLSEIVGMKLK